MTIQELIRTYERCMASGAAAAAGWEQRDPEAAAFADWVAQFWARACPGASAAPPHAIGEYAGGADAIRWLAADGAILGYVAGHPGGCYRIPNGEQVPDTGSAPGSGCPRDETLAR